MVAVTPDGREVPLPAIPFMGRGGTTGHRGEGEGTALPSNNLHLRYTASLEQSVSFLSQLPLNTPQYVQRIPGNDFFANVCLLRLLREKDVIHFV
jgi:hypothetical protein